MKERLVVGRGPEADVDLTPWDRNYFVSRRHAVITCDDGKWMIACDRAASNPTFVNSKPLQRELAHPLVHGDKIAFADISFEFHQK